MKRRDFSRAGVFGFGLSSLSLNLFADKPKHENPAGTKLDDWRLSNALSVFGLLPPFDSLVKFEGEPPGNTSLIRLTLSGDSLATAYTLLRVTGPKMSISGSWVELPVPPSRPLEYYIGKARSGFGSFKDSGPIFNVFSTNSEAARPLVESLFLENFSPLRPVPEPTVIDSPQGHLEYRVGDRSGQFAWQTKPGLQMENYVDNFIKRFSECMGIFS